jgi:hypothetical protein
LSYLWVAVSCGVFQGTAEVLGPVQRGGQGNPLPSSPLHVFMMQRKLFDAEAVRNYYRDSSSSTCTTYHFIRPLRPEKVRRGREVA